MNTHACTRVLTALCLAMAAGAALPALAQTTPSGVRRLDSQAVDFRSAHWLSDRKVVNDNGEEIAAVSDLILERGAGRIAFMVVKTGTTLGMGGRAVALPYSSFRWDAADGGRFVLASTPEQLKLAPEFTADSWKEMKDPKKGDKNALHARLASDTASIGDPYTGGLDAANRTRVEGEVTSVERTQTSNFGEQIEISVLASDGAVRRVALGPSWYVNGSPAAPMRGDKVVVETFNLPRDPAKLLVGSDLRCGDRQLALRDTSGAPAWTLASIDSGGRAYSSSHSRHLLLSELPGARIDCRGAELGKVHEIIMDRASGVIGFLSVDPNQNFLGIADTKRLVPWSVAAVGLDGSLRLDASKDMILASPETPKDPTTLNAGGVAERTYKAFGVPVPRFSHAAPAPADQTALANAWTSRGLVVAGIEPDTDKTITGTVVDMTEVAFEKGVPAARAVKVRVRPGDAGEETVLLGPAWYMNNQKLPMKAGDTITLVACRTTIDGHRHWLARSIDGKDARLVLIDGAKAPVWSQP